MDCPISISWTSSFPIVGLLGGIFHFDQILKETSVCKQLRIWCSVLSGFALFADVPQKGR